MGVTRALCGLLSTPLTENTSAYGEAFEHFIIVECKKLASYFHSEYRFSHLKTKDDVEVDLVVERPGQPLLFIEIKSTVQVREDHLKNLHMIANDFPEAKVMCFSRDPYPKKIQNIQIYPWQDGIRLLFGE